MTIKISSLFGQNPDISKKDMNVTGHVLLDGRKASAELLETLQKKAADLVSKGERPPGLLVLQVGDNPASDAYIRQKKKAAEQAGFFFKHEKLSRSSSFQDIFGAIHSAAADPLIDGMILQLPLDTSQAFSSEEIQRLLEAIPPNKDADGLHSFNQGKLFTGESLPSIWTHPIPATPFGIFRLLEFYKIPLSGKEVTVIGKSRLVGLPTAVIAAHMGATVSVCNRLTKDLKSKTQNAEILIVAAGKQHLIQPDHVNSKAIVVDVGIHRLEDGKLTGDVSLEAMKKSAGHSPVPGGVGPMTVACLMENTYRLRCQKTSH